ncbi:MAG: hypothetical protein BWY79_00705 [Actinobacteria bacterium ADurb.Bin444]|nr:MAG: hypothetical protein BWY79_00705 [Actinobacteria bacterium ADurb.Bin444]
MVEYSKGMSREALDESLVEAMYSVPGLLEAPPCGCTSMLLSVRHPTA